MHLEQQSHYHQVADHLAKMADLAGEDEIDQETKDRFAMYAALVDKHWRICERLLPKQVEQQPDAAEQDAIPDVHRIVERLIGHTLHNSGETPVPNGSVVPAPIRPTQGGHGDPGSES